MACSDRAGTQTARSGGTSQRPFGVVTCMVPRAAYTSCASRCIWVSSRVPLR